MFDQVSEHLHELKALVANPSAKELDIERWCQSVMKNCLGYTATSGYTFLAQETRGRMRPDFIISKNGAPVIVVEIKNHTYNLDKSDLRSGKVQLGEYLNAIGNVRWGILSNGYEWRLFDFSDPTVGGVEVVSFDLRNDEDQIDVSKKAIEDLSWNFYDLHETVYSTDAWDGFYKEATAFSPESLARAILSFDVVKDIAKVIRGEHEYKANTEVLFEKVITLLERGLDDSVPGWNETKQAELYKYAKAQKRVGRRRQTRKVTKEETAATPPASAEPQKPETGADSQPPSTETADEKAA